MTVSNTVGKIGRRFAIELDGLVAEVLEQSIFSVDSKIVVQLTDKKATNTIGKLRRRTVFELQDLKMSILENSISEISTFVNMKNKYRDTTGFNRWYKLNRRKYGELQGLYIDIIENSNKKQLIKTNKIKIVKPHKKYKAKIKLHFKNGNKIKY